MRTARALLLVLAAAAGCSPPGPGPALPDDVVEPDAGPLPQCPQSGELYGLDKDGLRQDLGPGSGLAVVLGFQGFQFAQVGLRSPVPLPDRVRVKVFVTVPGVVDQTASYSNIHIAAAGTAWESASVLIFFNDVPLVDLLGHEATISLRASTGECNLLGTAQVTLTEGGFMDADAGVWDGFTEPAR